MDKDTKDFLAFLDQYDRREQGLRWLQKELAAAEREVIAKTRRELTPPHAMLDSAMGERLRLEPRVDVLSPLSKAGHVAAIVGTVVDKRHTRLPDRNAEAELLLKSCDGDHEAVVAEVKKAVLPDPEIEEQAIAGAGEAARAELEGMSREEANAWLAKRRYAPHTS